MSYNVVDSSGWIEFFRGGPNRAIFRPVVLDIANLIVPTVTVVEVSRHLARWCGTEETQTAVAHLKAACVVELDFSLALLAGRLGMEHKLPIADSIIYATAHAHNATLWTQDADFEKLPNVRYVPKQ